MSHASGPSERPRLPAGVPGWKRGSCLGCGTTVVRARHAVVGIGGTRDGSYLIVWGDDPLLAQATDPEGPPDKPLYILGVAHQRCMSIARERIESGTVELAAELPLLEVDQGEHLPERPYLLHLPTAVDACPFCGQTSDLTREHVWPDWYSRLLRDRGVTLAGRSVVGGRIDVTVAVCRPCNNTWMSVLENDARPVLTAMMDAATGAVPPLALSPTQQTLLASWAVKTAYLIDTIGTPAVPRGFLHEFALKREPNAATIVWVGGYTPDVPVRADKQVLGIPSSGGAAGHPGAVVVTFTIDNVLFHVLGGLTSGTTHLFDKRDQFRSALFPIWPPRATDLPWPPSAGFSNASWEGLSQSIEVEPAPRRPPPGALRV